MQLLGYNKSMITFKKLLFEETLDLLNVELNDIHLDTCWKYFSLLDEWNQKVNLTGIKLEEDVRRKHFLDSLYCFKVIEVKADLKIIDVGSGAGFPGLPLKIFDPTINLGVVESVRKKTDFISLVVQELGLDGVDVFTARAEEIGRDVNVRGKQDWAIGRAVARLPVLLEYLLPLVKVGGKVLAQKGKNGLNEILDSKNALKVLGGKIIEEIKYHIPGVEEDRYLIVVEKVKAMDDKYPRHVGVPSKSPL